MKKISNFLACAAILTSPSYAAPHLMGLSPGIKALGTPSPTPTPTPGALVPGSTPVGSWSATINPGQQGSSTFQTIAQWDDVPRAGKNNGDRVCVVAFSPPNTTEYNNGVKNAIAKVRFIANNGTPIDVSTPVTDGPIAPRQEYCVTLDLSAVTAGTYIEARFIAYPTNGMPAVGQGSDDNLYDIDFKGQAGFYSLFFQAKPSITEYYVNGTSGNDGNSCTASGSACATITGVRNKIGAADYANIEACLYAGNYSLRSTGDTSNRTASNGWFTITTCPGVAKNAVTLTDWGADGNGSRISYTRIKGIQISNGRKMHDVIGQGTTFPSAIWLDNVDWVNDPTCQTGSCGASPQGSGYPFNFSSSNAFKGGVFVTSTLFQYFLNGPYGCNLCRNLTVRDIASDSFQMTHTVLNSTVEHVNYCCGAHPDWMQRQGAGVGQGPDAYNIVFYGNTATLDVDTQGIFNTTGGRVFNSFFGYNALDNSPNTNRNMLSLDADGDGGGNNFFLANSWTGGGLRAGSIPGTHFIDQVCPSKTFGVGTPATWTIRGSSTCQ